MVYRIFAKKKADFAVEANSLLSELRDFLNIQGVEAIDIYNRYMAEDIDPELFEYAKTTVFSEPPVDELFENIDENKYDFVLIVEALPGQFDMRAASAEECIQLLSQKDRPIVKHARVYCFKGELSQDDEEKIRKHLINPVETRETTNELPLTLKLEYPTPDKVDTVEGFIGKTKEELGELRNSLGLAMDLDDLIFLQDYFKNEEKRNPTITEVRVVDTYWSDHCRHTTFSTHLDEISIEDEEVKTSYENFLKLREEVYGNEKASKRPITLMDIGTLGGKLLKKRGLTPEVDISEEINACSINVEAKVDGQKQDWLLMFKNETHNHPTEIEPFGGAATCIGGCIRDPLSGRVYVHQAMRVTGAGDPRTPLENTLKGKLPQRKIVQTAAAGYSSYGNQIGLATGIVSEMYHEGYVAKHLECGALVGAAPKENVVREVPQAGDIVVLLGGRTGRDGIGGATGSSKSHDAKSLTTMASEVQKGNAPEERKIQRLFRNKEVTRLIKRCNDFGAGGVSVAIGELADGLTIDLDAVRKKYDGLDGTEIAISESQERMAVVLDAEDVDKFIELANGENLEAYVVARVEENPRMIMNWKGNTIVNLSREFLNSNGATKHVNVLAKKNEAAKKEKASDLRSLAKSLKSASQRGLVERFDSTIGARSLLLPFGGKRQLTPSQAMAALLPVLPGQKTDQASLMAYACDPDSMMENEYKGAKASVYTSIAKIVAAGGDYTKTYLTFQEFFEKLKDEPARWGKPFKALLGALDAQVETGAAAIGGKDSMSGTFLDLDVPPTLISFAVAPVLKDELITTEFKGENHPVCLFAGNDVKEIWDSFEKQAKDKNVLSAWAIENSIAEGIMKMSFGNNIGFTLENKDADLYSSMPGFIIAECEKECGTLLGYTNSTHNIIFFDDVCSVDELVELNEAVLEGVYPTSVPTTKQMLPTYSFERKEVLHAPVSCTKPKALIPVFPGTNCEYDTADALMKAGADPQIFVIKNLSSKDVETSAHEFAQKVKETQMIVIPGGFSGGDEPDGSAKFIAAFFRSPEVKEEVNKLLEERKGLMLGICNGFQALIKLGLVPYGRILDIDSSFPTLTYNVIGRHQSKIVHTRIASNKSPWFAKLNPGDIVEVPISHGEGRFVGDYDLINKLAENGQIATQYVDLNGNPTLDCEFNPNGSYNAIEGITSFDGRVLGKMGHSERIGEDLYQNLKGNYDAKIFEAAVEYFK